MQQPMKKHKPRFIFSAGGTGGHIFPALATADALRQILPDAKILFIGAEKRMEMEKVPLHGYPIIGLPIQGLKRSLSLSNLIVPFKILKSLAKARKIIKDFRPDVVAGFGGYASGPVLKKAASMQIPTLLQEQNSFPGLTNRILAKNASTICVAYHNMDTFFESGKIAFTGNPVRQEICNSNITQSEGRAFFGLDANKFTILAVGGSLGARTINETICSLIPEILEKGYQLIWQTGKNYAVQACEYLYQHPTRNVVAREFFFDMPEAYAAADLIVSRAGAIAVSEIAVVGKPVIYIPSPNVTDDHQTKNAMAMVSQEAALLVKDIDAREQLGKVLFNLASNNELRTKMAANAKLLALPNAAHEIAAKMIELMEKKQNATH